MRKHLTYANVAATMALVFAMSGGALAAKHYLVNSTSQINPKVLKKLRGRTGRTGKTGATGKAGAAGAPGAPGKEGAAGPPGPFPTTLPSGRTLTGTFVLSGTGETVPGQTQLSFNYALASLPTVHIIGAGTATPAGCTGNVEHPGAAPGNLCIFEGFIENFTPGSTGDYEPAAGVNDTSGVTGIILFGRGNTKASEFTDAGSWAVTAA